eukprot:scaffold12235_cov44-Attheya_sp.AAC.5
MKLPLSCALFVALAATAVQVTSAVELTAENFDALTAGKNAFVKYQAPFRSVPFVCGRLFKPCVLSSVEI